MPFARTLFPEPDLIEVLIEQSMPWFMAWCFGLALVLSIYVAILAGRRLRPRSPVEKLLRRRLG